MFLAAPIPSLDEIWKQTFNRSGIKHTIHPFGGECSLAEIECIKNEATDNQSDVIVAFGGGKVLDAARAAATDLNLPVVTCPTVASSNAPCNAPSGIKSDEGVVKSLRIYRKNPDLVLVEKQVIAMRTPRLLVSGIGDAFATGFEAKRWIEGRVKTMRGGFSTQTPLTLADLWYETLLADGSDARLAVESKIMTPALDRIA